MNNVNNQYSSCALKFFYEGGGGGGRLFEAGYLLTFLTYRVGVIPGGCLFEVGR